jgi:intracellular septation protein
VTETPAAPSAPAEDPNKGALGKLAMEFGPLLVFFLANSFYPVAKDVRIFYATGCFMAAMAVAMVISWRWQGKIAPMLWVNGAVVGVFGGLTIALHDEFFIKIKPTLVNGLFATVLFGGLLFDKPVLKTVLGHAYPGLKDAGWRLLTRNWAIFFVFLAALNETVWRTQTTDFWVAFKVWGVLPITLLFAASQIPVILKYAEAPPEQPAQS